MTFYTSFGRRRLERDLAGLAILLLLQAGVATSQERQQASSSQEGVAKATVEAEFFFRNWDMQDGLPDSTVKAIAQTLDGYLWVGTRAGLARFDGVHFRVFTSENAP